MSLLEPQDELGLPWDDWADGRVHRLVRGRDFLRSAELVVEAAENAARRLDKVARTVKEVRHGRVFVWLQFVDHELVLGDQCPCGSRELRRVSLLYVECAACGATSFVRPPKKGRASPEGPASEDEPLVRSLFAVPTQTRAEAGRGRARSQRPDITQLRAFTEVELYRYEADHERERFYGLALGPGGERCLLVVDFEPDHGGGEGATDRHLVWSVPMGPFEALLRLEWLDDREPDLRIGQPSAVDPDGGASQLPASWSEPPERLPDLRGVALFGQPGSAKKSERYLGYGRTPDGESVLLSVRFRLRDGARIEDPRHPGEPLHTVRCVPLAPLARLVDVDELFARDPDLRISDTHRLTVSGDAAGGASGESAD